MERETGARQSQSEPKESSNGSQPMSTDPTPSSSTSSSGPAPSPVTPTPPRLTPNPLLLDSPTATMSTPITCSPPPPLTPAPSLSTSAHVTKSATPTSPHLLVPAPPKLTSTATPALRTYARPILPLPAKTQPQNSNSTTATTAITTTATSITNSSTISATTTSLVTKTSSSSLTNGSAKTVATTTSTPITPFHTPASPPGRQVSQSLPVSSPGLARANQNAAPVRQRLSQQTLLLGKGLRGAGQDQVLLRAQMLILTSAMRPSSSSSSSSSSQSTPASAQLQSLTLRPPPPGALTIPPSLRLKPPSSTSSSVAPPPPLSRPQTALFPPLRPRPVTTATTDNITTTSTPSRHLSVPPPTLYSRAVPLRPRLLSPNGLRTPTPKPFHPIAAAAAPPSTSTITPPTSISRPITGLKTQSLLSPGPPPTSSCFERSPSAARQLQIIALSSGRQLQNANATPQKLAVHSDSKTVLPLSPTLGKRSSPLPSPTSQKDKLKQEKTEDVDKAPKDFKAVIVDQREKEKSKVATEKDDIIMAKKPRLDEKISSDAMDVTEQSQSGKKQEEEKKMADVAVEDQSKKVQNRDEAKDSKNETKPRISEANALTSPLKAIPSPTQKSSPVAVSIASPVRTQVTMATTALSGGPNQSPVPSAVPVSSPVQETNQSHPSRFNELHSTNQDDNLSVHSDNQSALSSLSSQSPPCSPFISPATEPSLPPPQPPDHPTDLSHKPNHTQNHDTPTQPETLNQSEEEEGEEAESFDQSEVCPWEPRAWPEGQQVLTHLVEGFVIQEGLTPFPVNRSSLLVPDQVPKPQEVNGTNGTAALPVTTETRKQPEHSTDSEEEEEGGEPDDHNSSTTRPPQRDRAVLHCQFCGKRGHAHNFMRSKRFCSTSCARGFNVRLTKRLRALSAGSRTDRPRPVLNRAESVPGKPLLLRLPKDLWSAGRREKEVREKPPPAPVEEDMEVEAGAEEDDGDDAPEEEEEEEEEEEDEEEPAAMTTSPHSNNSINHNNNHISHTNSITHNNSLSHGNTQTEGVAQQRVQRRASAPAVTSTFRPAPSQWSVEEVTAFINTLPGCGDVAEAFRVQEIDGQALLLLTEDHLMTSMNIKLGPALKICAHINSLKNQ